MKVEPRQKKQSNADEWPNWRDAAFADENGIANLEILFRSQPPIFPGLQDANHHEDETNRRQKSSQDVKRTLDPFSAGKAATHKDDGEHNQDLQDERCSPADRARDETTN